MNSVLEAYGLQSSNIELFGSGLINSTWKLTTPAGEHYILQRVNDEIFKHPEHIAHNIKVVSEYLSQHHPQYNFVAPVTAKDGSEMIYLKEKGCFRLFSFIAGSHSKDIAETPGQAYEAATQFGKFTRLLEDFDIGQLKITIPHFHDLELRYDQFLVALKNGNKKRIAASKVLIKVLTDHYDIVTEYAKIKSDPEFKLRVTHHDTKISNVLFHSEDKAICVIDLDTIMPGYFISDLGDMMRTYLSPMSEDEKDVDKIEVRDEYYRAIVQGYYNEMKDVLTETEKRYFFYAGRFIIYMQALRFLTDHLNNDVYYGVKYPGQNFIRAKNQNVLLKRLMEKEITFAAIIT